MPNLTSNVSALRHKNLNKPKPFRLLRYFTIISLLSITVASVLLGIWYQKVSVGELRLTEERNNVALAKILSKSIWPQFAKFLNAAASLPVEDLRNHPQTRLLNQILQEQTEGLNIIRIKIYTLDGSTVFSSDYNQLGISKKDSPSFKKALTGKAVSKISFRNTFYVHKKLIQNRNVISSYVPIYSKKSASIEGVFEIHVDVTVLMNEIIKTQKKIIYGISSIAVSLFIILFFVIRHVEKIIIQYNEEQNRTTQQIKHQVFHDSLTGLPNRELFNDRLEHAMVSADATQTLLALFFIDLDRFKQVNDTLGHSNGDELLYQTAERLKNCVRPCDTVSRLSGDEFTIILEGLITIELVHTIAKRVLTALSEPYHLNEHEIFISCSMGISMYPFTDDDTESLIKKADFAMYNAKQAGKNCYQFYMTDMNSSNKERLSLEHDLHFALDNDELMLYFQPKIELKDWTMHSMEVLLRWQHPKEGIISPLKFIPILEENGLISAVGKWVLEKACQMNKQWQDSGLPPLRVAVNVSSLQFKQKRFAELVQDVLATTGLEPEWLELELTESCLMENVEENIATLNALKELGIKISIDDFGTGYSSLSYLCKLPIDTIKIDQSFIRELVLTRQNRSIVTAIISFAHGLHLDIVAEGVENVEQLAFLSAMQCTTVQGFLLSKPLPENKFLQLYRAGGRFDYLINMIRARHNSTGTG